MRTTLRNCEILELLGEPGELSVPEVCTRLTTKTRRFGISKLETAVICSKAPASPFNPSSWR